MCGYVTLLELLKDRLHSDELRWPCAPELGLGGDGYGQVADIERILRGWAGVANAAPMDAALPDLATTIEVFKDAPDLQAALAKLVGDASAPSAIASKREAIGATPDELAAQVKRPRTATA